MKMNQIYKIEIGIRKIPAPGCTRNDSDKKKPVKKYGVKKK